jgi:hypothetical protein
MGQDRLVKLYAAHYPQMKKQRECFRRVPQ